MPLNPVMPETIEIEAEQFGEGANDDIRSQEPQPEQPPPRQEPPPREPRETPRRAPEPEPAPEPDDDDERETPRPDAEADAASEAGKELAARKRGLEGRKQTIQEQINSLVRERSEIGRDTERGRAERAELQREIETLRGERERITQGERQPGRGRAPQPEPGFDPRDPRPVEGEFQDFAEFAEAVGRWGARQEVRAAERARSQNAEQNARQRWEADRQQKYSVRYKAFAEANPTFEQEINREDLLLSAPVVDVIKDSDVGPQMLLYLARHSREIDRLNAMHPVRAYGEMKKIEARLEGANSGSPQPVVEEQHSKAPAPIKPVGNASSRRSDTDDIPDADVSDDEHFERMNRRDEMLRKRGLNPRKGYGLRI